VVGGVGGDGRVGVWDLWVGLGVVGGFWVGAFCWFG